MTIESQQRMYDALKRICNYDVPERIRKRAQREWGLNGDEALEAAYENVLCEARIGIKGLKRPKNGAQAK